MTLRLHSSASEVGPGENLQLTLTNHGISTAGHGTEYFLERYESGTWVEDTPVQAASLVAIRLPSGDQYTWTLRIPEDAPTGRYRVRKHVRTDTGEQILTVELLVVA